MVKIHVREGLRLHHVFFLERVMSEESGEWALFRATIKDA